MYVSVRAKPFYLIEFYPVKIGTLCANVIVRQHR